MEFNLDVNQVKMIVDNILDTILEKGTHEITYTNYYVAIEFKSNTTSSLPNGNGYIISYGGILAEIMYLTDTYGEYNEEDYGNVIARILEREINNTYGSTLPAIITMGV